MRFEFATATRIVFGQGTVATLPQIVRSFGSCPLVVTGASTQRVLPLISDLSAQIFSVPGEPTVELVREGARLAQGADCDVVVSIGGGSAIDAGKAISAIAANGGEPLDFLEVVGKGQSLLHPPLPFIAVPTTAGTGSEVTRNAVLGSSEHGVKASLRSPLMLPRIALVDPELTLNLPAAITASTGLDALTQLVEPYVSARANPMVDALCVDGIPRAARALRRAVHNGSDREARNDMSLVSLFGGLALANAGLGVVHGFAAPIGGMIEAPHGAVCAAVLPFGMSANIRALRSRAPEHDALRRYRDVARILTGAPDAKPEDGVDWVRVLCRDLGILSLGKLGVTAAEIPDLVAKAAKASSMKANPIVLTPAELTDILEQAL